MSNVIPFPKRPGRHIAHRADRYAHPAYRYHRAYVVNGRIHKYAGPVDRYVPAHRDDLAWMDG